MEQKKDTVSEPDNPTVEDTNSYIKMDYNLESAEDRIKKVEEIIANTPSNKLTPQYLKKMGDYIINTTTRKENKTERNILTDNKIAHMNERETSFEGLAGRLESGEDGIYNMIANDKNIIVTPKKGFTKDDIENIPGLQELMDEIKAVDAAFKAATGRRKYLLKQQIIQMQEDQYELKKMFIKPVRLINISKSASKLDLSEEVQMDDKGEVYSSGLINLYDPKHISLLLCNYSNIKEECWDKFNSDIKWLMEDLDELVDKTLKDNYPLYYKIVIYKIDGKQNAEIKQLLLEEFGETHTVEYISALWRKKIPNMIAREAADEWLNWHFMEEEKGHWKRCSKCGQYKLAHPHFFSKNSTSKDGWYSVCKECRNKKK